MVHHITLKYTPRLLPSYFDTPISCWTSKLDAIMPSYYVYLLSFILQLYILSFHLKVRWRHCFVTFICHRIFLDYISRQSKTFPNNYKILRHEKTSHDYRIYCILATSFYSFYIHSVEKVNDIFYWIDKTSSS